MKKIFLFVIIQLNFINLLCAQQKIYQTSSIVGYNYKTQANINAITYETGGLIDCFLVDTTMRYLTIVEIGETSEEKIIPKKSNILQYNLQTHELLWDCPINVKQEYIELIDNKVFLISNLQVNDNVIMFDNESGEIINTLSKSRIIYVDDENKIMFTHRGEQNKIKGYSTCNGEQIWTSKISYDYGISDIVKVDETNYAVIANGISLINSKDGTGWYYETKTGKNKYGKMIAIGILGTIAAVTTGVGIFHVSPDQILDIVSNIIVEDEYLYFAGRKEIIKVNKNTGELIWQTDFEEKLTSKSNIFINDTSVVMVNYASLKINNSIRQYGVPFVASFSKETGALNYINPFNEKSKWIKEYQIFNRDAIVLSDSILAQCKINEGTIINQSDINELIAGEEIVSLIDGNYFINNNNRMKKLDNVNFFYVCTNKENVYSIDENFNYSFVCNVNDLWPCYGEYESYKFVSSYDETNIIDKNNEVVASLSIPLGYIIRGLNVFYLSENKIHWVDLSNIVL